MNKCDLFFKFIFVNKYKMLTKCSPLVVIFLRKICAIISNFTGILDFKLVNCMKEYFFNNDQISH